MTKKTCARCNEQAAPGSLYCSIICRIKAHCLSTEPDKCWEWTGATRSNGYGLVRAKIDGVWRVRTAARLMYAAAVGKVPKSLSVLNHCGTKNCCNPKHLRLADQELELRAENVAPG